MAEIERSGCITHIPDFALKFMGNVLYALTKDYARENKYSQLYHTHPLIHLYEQLIGEIGWRQVEQFHRDKPQK